MGRLFHWESKRMKTLQQIQAEENRELKAMIMVVPIAVLVFLYLAIGVAVTVTQRWFSPCSPYATRTYDRDFERTNALRGFILPVILWGPRFIEHVVQDDMPIRHFIFASDCQWTGSCLSRSGSSRVPSETEMPARDERVAGTALRDPLPRRRAHSALSESGPRCRCPAGWLRFPERGAPFLPADCRRSPSRTMDLAPAASPPGRPAPTDRICGLSSMVVALSGKRRVCRLSSS